jgi:predicted HNH restriction endonuclease
LLELNYFFLTPFSDVGDVGVEQVKEAVTMEWTRPLKKKDRKKWKHYDSGHIPKARFNQSAWNDGDRPNVHIQVGDFQANKEVLLTSGGSFSLGKQIGRLIEDCADRNFEQITFSIPDSDYLIQAEDGFQKKVSQSLKDSTKERRDRLAKRIVAGQTKPRQYTSSVTVFNRDEDVVAEVLLRADGRCEMCKTLAPFRRSATREPYLEVHHLVWLAREGDDTVKNAIALCPNCHREAHYGDPETWRKKLPPPHRNKPISTE